MGQSHSRLKFKRSRNHWLCCLAMVRSLIILQSPSWATGNGNWGRPEKAQAINQEDLVLTHEAAVYLTETQEVTSTNPYFYIKIMTLKYWAGLNADSTFGFQSLTHCWLWLLVFPPFKWNPTLSFDMFFITLLYGQATQDGCCLALGTSPAQPVPASPTCTLMTI